MFKILKEVSVKIQVLWHMTPYQMVNRYRRLGGTSCLHCQGTASCSTRPEPFVPYSCYSMGDEVPHPHNQRSGIHKHIVQDPI